jgi:hypothetical protein
MRGNSKARAVIENKAGFSVSVVTYAELLQGLRNKQELRELRRSFRAWKVRLLYISEEISAKAVFYMGRRYLSGSLPLPDSLICATAISNGEALLTANDRHYRLIKEVDLSIFRP